MSVCTYEDKSDVTFLSAELLLQNKKNTSCINPYYYSCFQLVNHFIKNLFKISKDDLNKMIEERRINGSDKNKDSHNITISIFGTLMEQKDIDDPFLINTITYLKKIRKQADYDEIYIKSEQAQQISLKAEKFREKLKDYKNEFI